MAQYMSPFLLHPQLEADSAFIRDLALSQLRLMNRKAAPWLLLVPRRTEIRELYELSAEDRAQLMEEITQASRALDQLYAPDKINVAALGNIVPQLHVHVIARFKSDAAWPDPVWGRISAKVYKTDAVEAIRDKLNNGKFWE